MNYYYLFFIIATLYFLIAKQQFAILVILGFIGYLIYNEKLLPKKYFELPQTRKTINFEFPKLERLFKESEDLYQDYLNTKKPDDLLKYQLKRQEIQHDINTIYFSFPYSQHKLLDEYFYQNYSI